MTRGWWEAGVLAACFLSLYALRPNKAGKELKLDPSTASDEVIRGEAAASLNATLEAWLQQHLSAATQGEEQRRKVVQRWEEVQAGIRELQAKLQRLQHIPNPLDGSFEEQEVVSRSLVFETEWGRDALERLRTWRSTLFRRMALRYKQEEREQTHNGTHYVPRVEPESWGRYDVAKPIVGCPFGQVDRVGGDGDGSKVLCVDGLLNTPDCIVYSLGSNGQYEFEEAMLASTTCDVHTLDCTWPGRSLDDNHRHFYHEVCLGRRTTSVVEASGRKLQYWDYPTVLKKLGHRRKRISLLKIDIEGYEFDVLAGWHERDGCSLPAQVAMEVHYQRFYNLMGGARVADTNFNNLFWPNHIISMGELSTWFGHFANLGYALVSRDDNPQGVDCCSEFTLIKVEQPGDCPAFA